MSRDNPYFYITKLMALFAFIVIVLMLLAGYLISEWRFFMIKVLQGMEYGGFNMNLNLGFPHTTWHIITASPYLNITQNKERERR